MLAATTKGLSPERLAVRKEAAIENIEKAHLEMGAAQARLAVYRAEIRRRNNARGILTNENS